MLISVYNNIWLHLLSILTNIVSFWYAKKCHFMDIIDRKCQFYVYKLTIMDTGTISDIRRISYCKKINPFQFTFETETPQPAGGRPLLNP